MEKEVKYKNENITGAVVHQSVSESFEESKSGGPTCPGALSWHSKLEGLPSCLCCLCALLFRTE